MRGRWLRYAVRLVGPVLLVLVVWRLGDVRVLAALLGRATLLPLLAACALNAPNLHLKVVRTQVIARLSGHRYSTRAAWRAMLPSLFLGMVTPGRVGDALRIQYLRRDVGVGYADGLAMVVIDRLCDLYVLAAFVALAAARFAALLEGTLGFVTWVGVGGTVLLPLLLLVPGPADRALAFLAQRFPLGAEASARFLGVLRALMVPRLAWAVPLTIAAFAVNYLQGWLVAKALGLPLAYVDVVHLMAVASLLGLLPISISGAGVREAFLALVFPALGLAPEGGVAFGILLFAVIYVACSVAGLVAWQLAPPPFGAVERPDGSDPETRLASSADPSEDVAVR